jgi:hypothetical protein
MNLKQILLSLGADFSKPVSPKNPYGTGLILHTGLQVKCSGKMGPNPRLVEDAAFDPPAGALIQHVIGTLTDVPADGKEAGVVPSERSDKATFVLEPDQLSIDPADPKCQVCGQPITL